MGAESSRLSNHKTLANGRLRIFEEGKKQFQKWGMDPNELEQAWFDNAIKSYQLASEKLREETALIFLHSNHEVEHDRHKTLAGSKRHASLKTYV